MNKALWYHSVRQFKMFTKVSLSGMWVGYIHIYWMSLWRSVQESQWIELGFDNLTQQCFTPYELPW